MPAANAPFPLRRVAAALALVTALIACLAALTSPTAIWDDVEGEFLDPDDR